MVIFWPALLVFLAVFVLILVSIGVLLFSLAKKGDERAQLIKMKAMSAAFVWTVAVLIVEVFRMMNADTLAVTNPLLVLVLVSIVFLVSLIVYKKKYGD